MNYLNSEPDFFKFLTEIENITKNTRTNYISWLRFLALNHKIDANISEFLISNIIVIESIARNSRTIYTKEKDISNFKSALNKYLKFIKQDFQTTILMEIENEVQEIKNRKDISVTERQNLTLSRIGQGKFRNELIKYWSGCSITKIDKVNLLVASHIKPWRESNNFERLDVFNGLLLLPNYDKLFDKGYINFDEKGKIRISKYLSESDISILNINKEIRLTNIEHKHKEYLHYHSEKCFIK
jgi:putative restriction endonuclease